MEEITLRRALEEYNDIYMASRNFAERTRIEYFNDLEDLIQFLDKLGFQLVRNIELPQLVRYLAELDRRGLAGTTRKRKVVSIRSFFSYLYQNQHMRINLSPRIIPPFAEIKSPRYLTKPEYERLLDACSHNRRDFALIQLILQTGIKLSELTRLTINDVELPSVMVPEMKDVGYLHILGSKSKKRRTIPLNSKACISLKNYFKGKHFIANSALFTNRFGEPLGPRGVEKIIKKYMLQTNIRDASVQSLRHTFGIHHIVSGAKLRTIQEVMGHRDSRTTSSYLAFVKEEISKNVQEHAL